jgi:hypothetical protein
MSRWELKEQVYRIFKIYTGNPSLKSFLGFVQKVPVGRK